MLQKTMKPTKAHAALYDWGIDLAFPQVYAHLDLQQPCEMMTDN
jgi:hypothetical protein